MNIGINMLKLKLEFLKTVTNIRIYKELYLMYVEVGLL